MRKYIKPGLMAIQTAFQYRFNTLLYMAFSLLPLIAVIYLWQNVYAQKQIIEGYTIDSMITYLIIAKILETLLLPAFHWSIQDEVSSGELSKYLTKPISYWGFWFSKNTGNKLVQLILISIPMVIIALSNREYFLFPNFHDIAGLIVAVILAMILYYSLYFLVSLFSFYFVEIASFFFTVDILLELLSGTLFPLKLLPEPFFIIVKNLPFAYLIDFPANIYLGRLGVDEILYGLFIQLIWIGILSAFSKYAWKRAMSKYESVGA
ncbi:ABC transporter permease [Bacillus safensis]|uniref:ABC transporter permease n=1 Tax=Bacillus safensis TaxID=561879 RepID=UPI0013D3D26F|nr:ABC-2 family transporter protein [Bacillus safensis]MBL4987497.1 ABC-2 family transporter protein [Bacillus safensis]MCA6608944.1 ABC-2 family transporter protein [Bacillus safensis]GMG77413.1 ABC-2 family transporter protein [Bacillus safensis]